MNYTIFIAGTIFLLLFTWFYSVRHKRYHGITRFFAFETIFIMLLMNLKIWFQNPFSFFQIISWILLISSAFFVLTGFILLIKNGKPDINIENTSKLVKSGIYGYIRHPLYFSLFLLGTGVMLKNPDIIQLGLGTLNIIAIYFTARIEEKEMIMKFGEEYSEYIKETKMFIPFLI
jgi:protein-S-isoprenylcysteine O-methyltransferase Ste14